METLAYAMRHEETANNSSGKYRGHLQLKLTALGIAEAVKDANYIKTLPPALQPSWIISSDLPSARQTAEICAKLLGLKLMKPIADLRGMDIGKFAGKSKQEAEAALKECFRHPDEKCGGGDTPRGFDARCARTFDAILTTVRKTGKIPLIVTHGSDTVFLVKRAGGAPKDANYQEPPVEPGGMLRINETEAVPIYKIADNAKPIPMYPADHVPGMRVPPGGSNCAKCEYLAANFMDCTNRYFIAWNGSNVIPGQIDEYCSDYYEPKEGALRPA